MPSLAQAAGQVAGPQIRNQGTMGGNLCLDTRCTYYNQSYFWREALGFCLKKDGDVCHVTRTGKKCVAAHSADTVPALITLGAQVDVVSADGTRTLGVDPFFIADGKWNTVRRRDELVARVRIPLPGAGVRTAYTKVRQRNSIDFPLLSIAAAAEVDGDETVQRISLVVSALGSRPRVVTGLDKLAAGQRLADVVEAVAQQAFKQCHPLENLIVDPDWRRAMVPVYVRRTLLGMTTRPPAGGLIGVSAAGAAVFLRRMTPAAVRRFLTGARRAPLGRTLTALRRPKDRGSAPEPRTSSPARSSQPAAAATARDPSVGASDSAYATVHRGRSLRKCPERCFAVNFSAASAPAPAPARRTVATVRWRAAFARGPSGGHSRRH